MMLLKFIRLIEMGWTPRVDVHRCQCDTRIIIGNCLRSIALQNVYLFVADYSHVSQAKRHHVHRARMATRNWLFSHIRGTHAQNVAVSVLYFSIILHFSRSVTIFAIRPAEGVRVVLHSSHFYCQRRFYIYIYICIFDLLYHLFILTFSCYFSFNEFSRVLML